jgi:hypothetical protein
MYRFKVKLRIAGRVSYVQVEASGSAHARSIVMAQYGASATILQTTRLH